MGSRARGRDSRAAAIGAAAVARGEKRGFGIPIRAPLAPHWAFVVQLRQGTALTPEALHGRVEHIVSGQATRFPSLEELRAFLAQVLTPRGRSLSHLVFGLLSLAACGLLAWQYLRFELSSWRFGDVAPTYLATPLWLPRAAMAIGLLALCFSLCRTVVAESARLLGAAHGRRDVA